MKGILTDNGGARRNVASALRETSCQHGQSYPQGRRFFSPGYISAHSREQRSPRKKACAVSPSMPVSDRSKMIRVSLLHAVSPQSNNLTEACWRVHHSSILKRKCSARERTSDPRNMQLVKSFLPNLDDELDSFVNELQISVRN